MTAATHGSSGLTTCRSSPLFDTLIRGAKIVDGTGSPWYRADVGVRDGRIVEIGALGSAAAERTLDVYRSLA